MSRKGIFITLEGIDGSGKTIQSKLLFDYLISKGIDATLTREPGGTNGAEEIRKLTLTGSVNRWEPITESLLFLASRSDHWLKKIKPDLDKGKIVVCDRFQDSSVVYQGMCKGVDIKLLNDIYENFTGNRLPDKTLLIDIDPKISIARSVSRSNTETRFERIDMPFHEKARESFLKIAKQNERFCIIDGNNPIDKINEIIVQKTLAVLFNQKVL